MKTKSESPRRSRAVGTAAGLPVQLVCEHPAVRQRTTLVENRHRQAMLAIALQTKITLLIEKYPAVALKETNRSQLLRRDLHSRSEVRASSRSLGIAGYTASVLPTPPSPPSPSSSSS